MFCGFFTDSIEAIDISMIDGTIRACIAGGEKVDGFYFYLIFLMTLYGEI